MPVRYQLFAALVLPATAVIILVAYFAESVATRALERALGARLTSVAEAAVALLDPRLFLLSPGDDASRPRLNATEKLQRLKDATNVERIFLIRLPEPTALLDTRGELAIGDEYGRAQFDEHELSVVGEGKSVASFLFRSAGGQLFKTGYAPFRNEDGVVIGAVGVNAPASFDDDINALRATVTWVASFGLLALIALAVLSARTVSVPLARLSRAAAHIGQGELETAIPVGGPREVSILSDAMRSMTTSLKAREEEMQMMLAGIAHEVRNPLGGLELFGGLLKEDLPASDPRHRHVDRILKELGTLARVVTEFLEFARRREPVRREVDLGDLVADVLQVVGSSTQDRRVVVRAVMEARGSHLSEGERFGSGKAEDAKIEAGTAAEIGTKDGMRMREDAAPEAKADADAIADAKANTDAKADAGSALFEIRSKYPASVDPESFHGALLNLVQNALQASPEGGVVTVRLRDLDDALQITVEDEGPGISEELCDAVFRPFFTTKQKGTGLGLALAKKAVEAHGGTISIARGTAKGATFIIRLPKS